MLLGDASGKALSLKWQSSLIFGPGLIGGHVNLPSWTVLCMSTII
jgi:hypothetical protein